MKTASVSRAIALEQLDRVLASAAFRGAERSRALLRFLVVETLEGRADRLKEYTLGVNALQRGETFDPRTDPIVRAEVSRLRGRLERYYAAEGLADEAVIVLSKGSYVPEFQPRSNVRPDEPATPSNAVAASITPRAPRWGFARVAIAVVAGVGIFAAGLWIGGRRPAAVSQPVTQFDVELQTAGTLGSEVGANIALTPDGARLAFVATGGDGVARISTRLLSKAETVELPGTEGARGPFFSPDGRWLGFWAAGTLKKIAVDGGSPVVLCPATDLLGASWGTDDTIIAALNSSSTLWRVSASGGVPVAVGVPSTDGTSARWPQILPDGTHVLYTAVRGIEADRATIEVLSLRDGTRKVLARGGTFGRYLAAGYLSYVNQGTLYVASFDVDRIQTSGEAVPALDGIAYSPTFGYADIDISREGMVVYRKAAGNGRVVAVWVDSTGDMEPLLDTPGRYVAPRLSGDSRHFSMSVVNAGIQGAEFYDRRDGGVTRLPTSAAQHGMALWTPDSRYVVMHGPGGLSWARADGSSPEPLLKSATIQIPWSFTPNGDRLAYHELSAASAFDLWTVPIRSDARGLHAGTPELYLRTASYETYPSFSPDGRWLAYGSNESGTWEVYVRHFPDGGRKVQVSANGGRIARWSPNGRDLYYRTDGQRLMVVKYRMREGALVTDPPRPWGSLRFADTGVLPNFDLAPDGHRIVALMPAGEQTQVQRERRATVMLGFFEQLRRQLPAAR